MAVCGFAFTESDVHYVQNKEMIETDHSLKLQAHICLKRLKGPCKQIKYLPLSFTVFSSKFFDTTS